MEIASSASTDQSANVAQLAETNKDSANTAKTPAASTGGAEGDFAAFMKSALGGASKSTVNEEELFAALIDQRLEKVNPEAAAAYREEKSKLMTSMARGDGYVPVEDVAKAALKAVVASGKIDAAAAEKVHAEAFAAAQLDDKKDVLYDGRGSEGDPTIATSEMEAALMSMKLICEQIDAGEIAADGRSLDLPSNSAGGGAVPPLDGTIPVGDGGGLSGEQQLDGADGFLWKPESEKDGKLVVLLPPALTGLIDRVEIHSGVPEGDATKVSSGSFTSVANGDRSHWRFDKSGGEFGDNVYAVAYKENGDSVYWKIADGAARND